MERMKECELGHAQEVSDGDTIGAGEPKITALQDLRAQPIHVAVREDIVHDHVSLSVKLRYVDGRGR